MLQLGARLLHILKRLLPISVYLLQVHLTNCNVHFCTLYLKHSYFFSLINATVYSTLQYIPFLFGQKDGEYLSGHEVFLRRVAAAYNNFAETTERACREK